MSAAVGVIDRLTHDVKAIGTEINSYTSLAYNTSAIFFYVKGNALGINNSNVAMNSRNMGISLRCVQEFTSEDNI